MKRAYLAGGCFWCICDYILSLHLTGVEDVLVGYSGGDELDVTYELVKSQNTKHRETIEIIYDENNIKIENLLEVFASYVDIHNPNGQYIDTGYSYTLALYYQTNEEKELFTSFVQKLPKPAYIAVEEFKFFVNAEEYHQHYAIKNPDEMMKELISSNRTCHINLKRKIKQCHGDIENGENKNEF